MKPFNSSLIFVLIAWSFVSVEGIAQTLPKFKTVTLDANIGKVCYAVTTTDVNGDKRPDIVAVTENRVLWFKSPEKAADFGNAENWRSFVMIENQTEKDNVCIAPYDIDGDGKIDFALGAGWTRKGTIQWLSRGKSLDEKWSVHEIGTELWLHRMSFADVLGTGRAQLVVSPLNKTKAKGARLIAFKIPEKPKTDRWIPEILNDSDFDKMHNHTHFDFVKEKETPVPETLVSNQSGATVVYRNVGSWKTKKISDQPSGEIKLGKLKNGQKFIATIEPMHGNRVAVYTRKKNTLKLDDQLWDRTEIENELAGGHALIAADLDGDGSDELIVGHRLPGKGETRGPGLYIYQWVPNPTNQPGMHWKKTVLDNGGVAVEDATVADLDGDGDLDIIAGGRSTHNLKIYLNQRR